MIAACNDKNPVVFIEDRWLYSEEGEVPDEMYEVPIGKANVLKEGTDLSIIAASYMVKEAMLAAKQLETKGIHVEVVDIRTIKPLDVDTIVNSVKKTKKALVAVADWNFCGVASHISSVIYDHTFGILKMPVQQVTLPDCHAPASHKLEEVYYPKSDSIVNKVLEMLS
jgi:pyruvate dehydrogenase E1 component beta subunit